MKDNIMHITDRQMQLYVRNELSSYERERVELEIELCDECLEKFLLYSSEGFHVDMPSIEAQQARIEAAIKNHSIGKRTRLIQRPWLQFVVAASITGLIVLAGVTTGLSSKLASYEESLIKVPADSISEATTIEKPAMKDEIDQDEKSDKWLLKARDLLDKLTDFKFE